MRKLYIILSSILMGTVLISCSSRIEVVPVAADKAKPVEESVKETVLKEIAVEEKVLDKSEEVKTPNVDSKTPADKADKNETKRSKVIVLDPGHASKSNLDTEPVAPGSKELKIKDGGGAQGIDTRTPEYKINMDIALELKGLLESKGYTVIMTKTDNALSLGNVERAEIWNKANAELAVRIHADSNADSSVKGASMLIPSASNQNTKPIYAKSKENGKIILDTLTAQVGMKNRGLIESNDMTGFNWSKVPVILVEMGFLSNRKEDKLLSSKEYQHKICKALADGIALAVK